jgi:hypothetical protein
MPAGTNKNVAYIAVLAVLVPCLIGLWFALPVFLPMYLWTEVDFRKIAAAKNLEMSKLETEFTMQVRYHPRGEGDPIPWQIISMAPAWKEVYPDQEDEFELLVRCTLISGNDGKLPSTTFINSTYKDRYYTVPGFRLPPGSLGANAKRPVVVYKQMDFARMDISSADMTNRSVSTWENDDEWEERDDGWSAPK